jgi:hypothetical protein
MLRPRGPRQLIYVLEREAWCSVGGTQIEPVSTRRVVLVGARRLVPWSVDEPKQLTPELGAGPCIGAIEDDLCQAREG